jgi:hypothetical protein
LLAVTRKKNHPLRHPSSELPRCLSGQIPYCKITPGKDCY